MAQRHHGRIKETLVFHLFTGGLSNKTSPMVLDTIRGNPGLFDVLNFSSYSVIVGQLRLKTTNILDKAKKKKLPLFYPIFWIRKFNRYNFNQTNFKISVLWRFESLVSL